MKVVLIVLGILTTLLIISQLYFTMAKTETQPYRIIKSTKDFEIRLLSSCYDGDCYDECKNIQGIILHRI